MLRRWLVVAFFLAGAVSPAAAAEPVSLARARSLYNAGNYEGAIEAAEEARVDAEFADAAALVIARSYLEQFRERARTDDLARARETLRTIHPDALNARDQVDLLVGLGQSLYLGEVYGAAAELFDTALARGALLNERDRLMLLDWWASALDREAQTRLPDRRAPAYERIVDRMERTLREDPGNSAANYWLAVAARGAGDIDRAWNAAIAAWVRSGLSPATADNLRMDIDRLVTQALIPERARQRALGGQPDSAGQLAAEWDLVKTQWK